MKIVIATGGTGGHLLPALRVAKELRQRGFAIHFIGSFRRGMAQIENEGFTCDNLNHQGLDFSNWWKMLRGGFSIFIAIFKAIGKLFKEKPDVVFGFGGYGAFPIVFAANILRYPTVIHEQNVIPGRANALLSKFVKKVAISFQESSAYFDKSKTVLTGCPCHAPNKSLDRQLLLQDFNLDDNRLTILIVGGSQGSQKINEYFLETAKQLSLIINFQVIHIAGLQDRQRLSLEYARLGLPFVVLDYFNQMEKLYSSADIVIARAGASTISEIINFELNAILIPYPFAGGHQKANANVLSEIENIKIIEEKDLNVATLEKELLRIVNNRDEKVYDETFLRQRRFLDSTHRLAKTALEILE